jgi:hypothetical protein
MTTSPCSHLKPARNPIVVNLPDGSTIESTHTCTIDLPGLPEAARTAHIFPALADHSLLSVGQICDAECQVEFTATHVNIRRNNKCLLQGHRTPNGLWSLDLQPSNQGITPLSLDYRTANSALARTPNSSTIKELIHYLHGCCFCPRKITWIQAIKNNQFTTWPGLTVDAVNKHFTPAIATALGHLDQKRKNWNSTKPQPESEPEPTCHNPTPLTDGKRTHSVYAALESLPTVSGAISCLRPNRTISSHIFSRHEIRHGRI